MLLPVISSRHIRTSRPSRSETGDRRRAADSQTLLHCVFKRKHRVIKQKKSDGYPSLCVFWIQYLSRRVAAASSVAVVSGFDHSHRHTGDDSGTDADRGQRRATKTGSAATKTEKATFTLGTGDALIIDHQRQL